MAIGTFGRLRVFEDFLGFAPVSAGAAPTANLSSKMGNLAFTCLNEGTNTHVVDEPGGILQITTAAYDNDNAVLWAGPFQPADGGCAMECRFKNSNVTTGAIFAGFSETLHQTGTPVMPAEYASITLTISSAGGMAGMQWDPDGTDDDWRAVAADGSAVATDLTTATGTVSGEGDAVNDEWDIVRVELDVNGDAKIYHEGVLIDDVAACVTAGDNLYACLMIEARSSAAKVMEVDYFYAEGGRDWTV